MEERRAYQCHIDIFSRLSLSFAVGLARLLAERISKVVKILANQFYIFFITALHPDDATA